MSQQDLFSGEELRDKGIQQAVDHANRVEPKWSEMAYSYLKIYILIPHHTEFMAEDVRKYGKHYIPEPPSNRAWGAIFVRAAKEGLIRRKGFRNVKNAKAHCTPATVWEVVRN